MGVDRNLIKHKLNIDATVKPRRQKLKKMSDDKVVAVSHAYLLKRNQVHLICAPGSVYTHMIDKMS
jgi:hypothetical protein